MAGEDERERAGVGSTITELDTETLPPVREAAHGVEPMVPALTVLCHPDPTRIGQQARLTELLGKRPVEISRSAPDFAAPAAAGRAKPLGDPYVSRRPLHLQRKGAQILLGGNLSGQNVKIQGRAVDEPVAIAHEALREGVVLEVAGRVSLLLHLVGIPRLPGATLGLVGQSDVIEEVRVEVQRVASSEAPVLLRGESGTGKELVARAVHEQSRRSSKPFMSINMAAVPAATAASELFGHAKGAFTGASRDAEGYFGRADGGTLFLDEIGDTPAEVQSMLLRALESGEIQPVGAQGVRRVDVRLVAATEASLDDAVEAGTFRPALYHRLAGYEIRLPPLRHRRDDIARLFLHFLREELALSGNEHKLQRPNDRYSVPWMSASVVARLVRSPWPGNVRQLRNVARRLALSSGERRTMELDPTTEKLLGEPVTMEGELEVAPSPLPRAGSESTPVAVEEITEEMLAQALRDCEFRPGAAAARLGIGRTTLYKLIDRAESIRKAADITDEELTRCWRDSDGDIEAMSRALEVSQRALKLRLRRLELES